MSMPGRALPKALALITLATLAAQPARASESDGGDAAPRRWTHARGPAAFNGRTTAAPLRSWGGPRWTYRAKDKIVSTPVTWDGIAYVLDGKELTAIDAVDGDVIARTRTEAEKPELAVESHCVLTRERGGKLVLYRLADGKLDRIWSHEAGPGASAPRMLNGAVACTAKGGLRLIRVGSNKPAWITSGNYTGAPAIYGGHVYALHTEGSQLVLSAHDRTTGKIVAGAKAGEGSAAGPVSVSPRLAAAQVGGSWTFFTRTLKDKKLSLKKGHSHKLQGAPLVGSRVGIGRVAEGWALLRATGRNRIVLIKAKERPELVESNSSPIAYGGSDIGFGNWCGDVNSNEIHWHSSESPALKGGVSVAVPADHSRLLVVSNDKKRLHLIGPRVIGGRPKSDKSGDNE